MCLESLHFHLLLLGLEPDGLVAAEVLILHCEDLLSEPEERVDEPGFHLQLHFLDGYLESSVLPNEYVLIVYLREGYHSLDEWGVLLVLLELSDAFLILVQLLNRTEEYRHQVADHVIDLYVVDLQVVLGDHLINLFHLHVVQLVPLGLLFGPLQGWVRNVQDLPSLQGKTICRHLRTAPLWARCRSRTPPGPSFRRETSTPSSSCLIASS